MQVAILILIGLSAGMSSGLFGIGGGVLIVPALVYLLDFPMHRAIGTSLAVLLPPIGAAAVYAYYRAGHIDWQAAVILAGTVFIGAWLGARAVSLFPPAALRPLILVLLIAVAIYTFLRKDFGISHQRLADPRRELQLALAIGAGLGFYDGFFGPGTGSFLIFLFIRLLQMDFLHASVMAKIVNVSTNLAAIAFFVAHGEIFWQVAGVMALSNLAGSQVGSALALRYGAAFIRKAFLVVVVVLILRFSADTFLA